MNFDFSEFFSDAGAKAQAALNDLVTVGRPAVEVAAAQWGQDLLSDWEKQSQKNLNVAIKDIQNAPSTPLGDALKTTIQGTFLETYGLYIVGGVVGLLAIGFFMRGK